MEGKILKQKSLCGIVRDRNRARCCRMLRTIDPSRLQISGFGETIGNRDISVML